MTSRFPKAIADERRSEVRTSFRRMLDDARTLGVALILLAGDIFDSDKPLRRDRDFFFAAVRDCPEIEFLYLRGNHDTDGVSGGVPDDLPNLHLFSEEWTTYRFGDVAVSGLELSGSNARSCASSLPRPDARIHIAMLHGQTAETAGRGLINVRLFRGRGLDYLALGHVHAYSEHYFDESDPRGGKYCYAGCLEGRGFDEPGPHGYVLLDTDEVTPTGELTSRFVPAACRTIVELDADVSGAADAFSAVRSAAEQVRGRIAPADLLRLNLRGDVSFDNTDLAADAEEALADLCYFVSVKDRTQRRIDPADYEGDLSLRGEFIRTVLADASLSDDEKQKIVSLGLRALGGRDVEV